MVRLIVFDLDHTLLKINSSFRFGFYLFRQKYFSSWKLLICLSDYVRHRWLGMSTQVLHDHTYSRLFKGRSSEEIRTYVDQFLIENLNSFLYGPVLQRLKEAQRAGDRVLILSSSPDFLVGEIARRLSVKFWKATVYQVSSQGTFCGISQVMDGEDKAKSLSDFVHAYSLPLSSVTVYSDSLLDLPLLELAGKAVCVCPNRSLERICLQRGWETLNEKRMR